MINWLVKFVLISHDQLGLCVEVSVEVNLTEIALQ